MSLKISEHTIKDRKLLGRLFLYLFLKGLALVINCSALSFFYSASNECIGRKFARKAKARSFLQNNKSDCSLVQTFEICMHLTIRFLQFEQNLFHSNLPAQNLEKLLLKKVIIIFLSNCPFKRPFSYLTLPGSLDKTW